MSRRKVVLSATAALLLAGGGTALGATLAATPVDGSGVIHGCWTTAAINGGSHTFVLRNAGTACPSGTTAISWNKTGPRGAPGPQGPAGSFSDIKTLNFQVSVPPNTSASSFLPCDPGYVVTGGGQRGSGLTDVSGIPSGLDSQGRSDGWTVAAGNPSPIQTLTIDAYYVCAKPSS